MRFTIVGFLLALFLTLAVAGPARPKISEKKSLADNTKLVKEVPKIEEIGDEKDRLKKSTTTFCVEIKPGSNEPVQIPCACKNGEGNVPESSVQQIPQPVSYLSPQQMPGHSHSPQSVNIIHAPPHPPQTLNIIQPAPTLHAVQFLQPQANNPPSVQTLNFLQPSAQLPEPVHQSLHITLPSKSELDLSEPVHSEKIVLPSSEPAVQPPSQPEPQPAPQPALQPVPEPVPQQEHSHKSEVHVSVITENKEDNEEQKSEMIVNPLPKPVETINLVPVAPIRQPYEEQVVVVPNPVIVTNQENCNPGTYVQVPSIPYGANYQQSESVIQIPGSTYQQARPFHTECSCKQTHPAHLTDGSSVLRTHFKEKGTKIIPMVIYPPAAPSVSVASPAHYNSEISSLPHSSSYPMVISMQTARNKEGMQSGEMSDMKAYKSMDTSARFSNDQTPNMYYDMSTGMQLMDIGRQAVPENQKNEENMKMSVLPNETFKPRFIRNDKDVMVNEKNIEE
ncbi:altered inheritance of mitochondria protein 3-like [Vespa mandarinia]|uniref:altered inheritance of mitochondria protein 3-like n=1 Tax=Vespa mandarinia TaxID=7446 RepID=UPI00160AA088|nr:altered inheritance of mitochondria protein 3-like [Vespa mandarinia]